MREKFPLKETRSVLYSSVLDTGVEEVEEGEGVRIKFTLSFHRLCFGQTRILGIRPYY